MPFTPYPQRPKEKCFPDHSYVIVIWCTYIFNKTFKNGLLCLKIYKIWGQKFKIGHFCWNDINIVNENVHNYYCYLLLFHLIYCFYCSIMCLKTYLLCQLCAEYITMIKYKGKIKHSWEKIGNRDFYWLSRFYLFYLHIMLPHP